MDAFYASVEQRDFPHLRGRPVVVSGSSKRGVISAASYEARKYGVKSAMPVFQALKRCPHLILQPHRFEAYQEASNIIRDIFLRYTPLVEPLSLDEAYLDVTQNHINLPSGTLIAQRIRADILRETGLTASAGVSFNKFLAKTASDLNKPNGLAVIRPEEAEEFLKNLPVKKFYGIGKATAAKMHRMGIFKGADLLRFSEVGLIQRFGKAGSYYFRIVRADDPRRVNPHRIRKSIGAERTFEDNLTRPDQLRQGLRRILEILHGRLQAKGAVGFTLSLKIKFSDFRVITRSRTTGTPLNNPKHIQRTAFAMLDELEELPPVRLLGLSVSSLLNETKPEGVQLEFGF